MQGDLISRDGTKKIVVNRNTIKIVSTETNEVLQEIQDTYGDHRALDFSDDGEKVLYISYLRGADVSTWIKVWDSTVNKTWTLSDCDHWAGYIEKLSYNSDFSIVALSGSSFTGASHVSLVRLYEKERVWHRIFYPKKLIYVESLRLELEKGLVWVSHDKGIEALSIKDGSTQSIYGLPSEVTLQ